MLSLIAAVASNRAIGLNNQLLWHLPADMRYFRETTRGKTVIMGRKTWESLPAAFRPLPGRRNIVLSRDPQYVADGAECVDSLATALRLAVAGDDDRETFVIGGAELYQLALPLADRLYLTEVAEARPGDAFFPEFLGEVWQEIGRTPGAAAAPAREEQPAAPAFDFVVYRRIAPETTHPSSPGEN